jgi:hypothetical protein
MQTVSGNARLGLDVPMPTDWRRHLGCADDGLDGYSSNTAGSMVSVCIQRMWSFVYCKESDEYNSTGHQHSDGLSVV